MIRSLLLGCTGSIGVLFLPTLIIKLRKLYNTDINVMMTANAQKFLTPYSFEILTGNPVTTDMFSGHGREHITLVEAHDVFLIAPATASMISKIANGIADDIVSLSGCVCIGSRTKLVIAPAMNAAMWSNPFLQANVEKLRGTGVHFVGPSAGTEIVKLKETKTALAGDEEIIAKLVELY